MQALALSNASYTLNFTKTAAANINPEVTALAVSLNGTNTTLFELPANGTSFTAHLGNYLFDGQPCLSASYFAQACLLPWSPLCLCLPPEAHASSQLIGLWAQ